MTAHMDEKKDTDAPVKPCLDKWCNWCCGVCGKILGVKSPYCMWCGEAVDWPWTM